MKQKQSTSRVLKVIIFCSVFVFSYILVSVIFWMIQKSTLSGGVGIYKSLAAYTQRHEQELRHNLFDDIFGLASGCRNLPEGKKRLVCIEQIKVDLGNTIVEEELAKDDGGMWPNDLFFVKQEHDRLYRLGWNGEIVDITNSMRNKPSDPRLQSMWSLIFRSHCNYFRSEPANTRDACEIYTRVPLSDGNYGYLVRLDPQTEEDDFWFTLAMPIIGWPLLFMSSFRLDWFTYGVMPSTQVLVPSFVSLYVIGLLDKRNKKAHRKENYYKN